MRARTPKAQKGPPRLTLRACPPGWLRGVNLRPGCLGLGPQKTETGLVDGAHLGSGPRKREGRQGVKDAREWCAPGLRVGSYGRGVGHRRGAGRGGYLGIPASSAGGLLPGLGTGAPWHFGLPVLHLHRAKPASQRAFPGQRDGAAGSGQSGTLRQLLRGGTLGLLSVGT